MPTPPPLRTRAHQRLALMITPPKWTKSKIARFVGCSPQAVDRWFSEGYCPSSEIQEKLEEIGIPREDWKR